MGAQWTWRSVGEEGGLEGGGADQRTHGREGTTLCPAWARCPGVEAGNEFLHVGGQPGWQQGWAGRGPAGAPSPPWPQGWAVAPPGLAQGFPAPHQHPSPGVGSSSPPNPPPPVVCPTHVLAAVLAGLLGRQLADQQGLHELAHKIKVTVEGAEGILGSRG